MSEYKQEVEQKNSQVQAVLTPWLPEFHKIAWCTKNILNTSEDYHAGQHE